MINVLVLTGTGNTVPIANASTPVHWFNLLNDENASSQAIICNSASVSTGFPLDPGSSQLFPPLPPNNDGTLNTYDLNLVYLNIGAGKFVYVLYNS